MKNNVIDTDVKMIEGDDTTLVSFIPKKYTEWDDAREINLALIRETKHHLYPRKVDKTEDTFNNTPTEEGAITELNKLPKVFKTRESAVSHYYNSTCKSLNAAFCLEPSATQEDYALIQASQNMNNFQVKQYIQSANDNANLMKACIVESWGKTKAKEELRKAITNWIDKGEGILFVTWETKTKPVRRKVPKINIFGLKFGSKYEIQQIIEFDGVKIISIDPEDFVFDVSRKGQPGCPKIYRSWKTSSEIGDNQAYSALLSPEDSENLDRMADENADKNNANAGDKRDWDDRAVNKGLIEVLDYWGDIKLQDRYLPNMHITIIARKYVVCFEYNPHIVDPFIYCDFEEHPDTRRGIGPLVRILPLNDATTDLFKLQKQAFTFTVNKNYLVPKGAITKSPDLDKNGGNIIEYDPALLTQAPIPLQYEGFERGWNFLDFFDKEIEVTSGEYAYDVGDDSGKARTLGEAQIISSGNNTRRGLYISDLTEKLILPCAERTGELLANYKDGSELVKIKDNEGNAQFKVIDNTIRQGNYEYTVGDTQALVEKQALLQQFTEVTQQVAKITPINGKEIARYAYSTFQIENPDRFLEVDPVEDAVSKLQPQAKEIVMQVIKNPAMLQKLQQPDTPSMQQVKDILSSYVINKAQLPDEVKMLFDSILNLHPIQEVPQ